MQKLLNFVKALQQNKICNNIIVCVKNFLKVVKDNLCMLLILFFTIVYKILTPYMPSGNFLLNSSSTASPLINAILKDLSLIFDLSCQELILFTLISHFVIKFTIKLRILSLNDKIFIFRNEGNLCQPINNTSKKHCTLSCADTYNFTSNYKRKIKFLI